MNFDIQVSNAPEFEDWKVIASTVDAPSYNVVQAIATLPHDDGLPRIVRTDDYINYRCAVRGGMIRRYRVVVAGTNTPADIESG